MNKLYAAWAKTDDKSPFEFIVSEIEIANVYGNGTIETKFPCCVSTSYSTKLFGEYGSAPLEKELDFPNGAAYYSLNKKKCINFLEKKRYELKKYAENLLNKLNEAKIVEGEDYDSIC